jgi:hypothetical protein
LEQFECRAPLSANTYTVNSLDDTGSGSGRSGDLLYAIDHALVNPGSTIDFGVTGTIQLMAPLPDLRANVTINASTGPVTILGGPGTSDSSIFQIDSGVAAVLSGLILAGNDSMVHGGAILY